MIIEVLYISLVLLIAAAIIHKIHIKKSKNFPPGPTKLPIIGNLLQIRAESSYRPEAVHKLSKKYGKIMSIKMGEINSVVLGKYEDIRYLYMRPELDDRENIMEVIKDRNMHQNLGMIWANGKSWETIKKFCSRTMGDFGFGKSTFMEIVVQDELGEFITYLGNQMKENHGIVQMSNLFAPLALNTTWRFVTGHRYPYSANTMQNLLTLNDDFIKSTDVIGISVAFPILRKLFPTFFGMDSHKKSVTEFHNFMKSEIQRHKNDGNRMNEPPSFIDVFINKIETEHNNPGTFFTAGTAIMSSALEFSILFLALNPDVQAKVQAEIDDIIPKNIMPNLDHKQSMIYTQATIWEILRSGLVVPLPTPRRASKDFYYQGFLIEKGTCVMANFYSVMNDKDIWGDPEKFRPERFINPESQTLDTSLMEKVNIFGHGKRSCFGERKTQLELFLSLTTLLQKLTFNVVPNKPPPTLKFTVGLTANPYPYETFITFRN